MVSLFAAATPWGNFWGAMTEKGLVRLALPTPREEIRFWSWVSRHCPQARQEVRKADLLEEELLEYFAGRRQTFSVPLDLQGSDFQKAVWQAIAQISYGKTTTYSTLAQTIGRPRAVRAVGAAVGANPVPIVVPCHRVLGSGGSLTGYAGGLELKRRLLMLEGVSIKD